MTNTTSELPIPEGFDVVPDGVRTIIRWRWYSPSVWAMFFFCIAWDAFLIFWYSLAFSHKAQGGGINLIMIIFPIAHVAVGVGLTYSVICTFLNRTDVILTANELRVASHPMPWIGNVRLNPMTLTSFGVRNRGRSRNNADTFDVMYVSNNREKTLIKGLAKQEQAEY